MPVHGAAASFAGCWQKAIHPRKSVNTPQQQLHTIVFPTWLSRRSCCRIPSVPFHTNTPSPPPLPPKQNSASGRLSRQIFDGEVGLFSSGGGAAVAGLGSVRNVADMRVQVQETEWFVGRAYYLLQEVSRSSIEFAPCRQKISIRVCVLWCWGCRCRLSLFCYSPSFGLLNLDVRMASPAVGKQDTT